MTVKTGRAQKGMNKTDTAFSENTKPRGAGLAVFLSLSSLLLTAGALGGGYYLYLNEYKPMKQSFQTANESVRQELSAQSVAVSDQLHQQMEAVGQVNQGLVSDQESLRGSFAGIDEDLSILRYKANWSQREWTLAEVGYLLRMADDRLIYMRDVETTKAALRSAVRRIEHLADPSLVGLEQQIGGDLQALNLYVRPDPNALLARLERLIAELKPYPFETQTDDEATPVDSSESIAEKSSGKMVIEEPVPQWVTLFKTAKNELTSRVRVARHDQKLNALDQNTVRQYQLELSSLRLEAIRMALLREDEPSFQREVLALESWAKTNLTSKKSLPIRAELQKLSKGGIFKPLPTLRGSWQALQTFLPDGSIDPAKTEEPTPAAVEPAPIVEPVAKPEVTKEPVIPAVAVELTPPVVESPKIPTDAGAEPLPIPAPVMPADMPELVNPAPAIPAKMPVVEARESPVIQTQPILQEQAVPLPEAVVPPAEGKPEVL